MPRPSRLATFTANELTLWDSAIACSTPSEPSTAAPPTTTGSAAATSEPNTSSSRISTIGSEIASAKARSRVDRRDDASPRTAAPATWVRAPDTASRSSTARNDSSFAESSSPARVSTATALRRSADAYCGARSAAQYEVLALTASAGNWSSRSATRWASAASSIRPDAGV
jgi:hypothetical protein